MDEVINCRCGGQPRRYQNPSGLWVIFCESCEQYQVIAPTETELVIMWDAAIAAISELDSL